MSALYVPEGVSLVRFKKTQHYLLLLLMHHRVHGCTYYFIADSMANWRRKFVAVEMLRVHSKISFICALAD